jgi:hypothetical protein
MYFIEEDYEDRERENMDGVDRTKNYTYKTHSSFSKQKTNKQTNGSNRLKFDAILLETTDNDMKT